MRRKKKNNIKGSKYMAEEKDNVEKEEKKDQEAMESVVGEVVEEDKKETEDPKDAKIAELTAKVKELEETVAKMKDDDLRRMADTENYKKRLRTEKENAVKYANEALISDLLEPLDNLQL